MRSEDRNSLFHQISLEHDKKHQEFQLKSPQFLKKNKGQQKSAAKHNSPGLKIGLSSPFDHVILQLEKVSDLGDSLLFAIDMILFVFTLNILMLK